jgi:predicted RecB family endonuclease
MGWVEVLAMPEVRLAKRCWVYIGGAEDYEEEVLVVKVGDVYVVGTVLDDWYAMPAEAVRRFLAKLLNVKEEVSLSC